LRNEGARPAVTIENAISQCGSGLRIGSGEDGYRFDLSSVHFVQNGVKERLIGQARRKSLPPAVPNQRQFPLSDWTKERH
jgi:hypothetical protein